MLKRGMRNSQRSAWFVQSPIGHKNPPQKAGVGFQLHAVMLVIEKGCL